MLLQLKDIGKIEVKLWDPNDDYLKMEPGFVTESYEFDDNMLLAQAFTFLTGGFEAIGISVMYAFFDLTQNPEEQEKAKQEVLEQVENNGGLTYEALKGMVYLDNIIKESQRLHPAGFQLFRECTKTYTFPNGHTAHPGDILLIPVLALHMDPANWENPLAFRPDRFQNNIRPGTYLPFGDGPRICIAMRFAQLQMKYALAKFLQHYKVGLM